MFMKGAILAKFLKAFIKPSEAPQRSEKFFISIQLSEMHGTGRVRNPLKSKCEQILVLLL